MSGQITVRGGSHGLAVALGELEEGAAVLETVGRDVAEVAVEVGACGSDPALALVGGLAPTELVAAESAVLACAGPAGAAGASARLLATAAATRTAVTLYREGEQAVESLVDLAATATGIAVGAAVAPVLGVGIGLAVGRATVAADDPAARSSAVAGGAAIAVGLGLGGEIDEVLREHPWLAPAAADALDGLVIGLGLGAPALGVWAAWRAGRLGVPYPPRTEQEALAVVLAATRGLALDESRYRVRVEPHPMPSARPPRSIADLVAADGPTSGGSRVRVTGVPRPDGTWTWVVDVPGTQTFAPRAGATPWDLTSDVLLVAGRQTLTMHAVAGALADAQRRVGAHGRGRVMLTGHSQGGLTAAALAADPTFRRRFGVTHVVTSGAPVARLDVPPEVSVLSLEHTEDLVPGLDGAENPDREGWVTVEREVAGLLDPDDGATDAHETALYTETARLADDSEDPSLATWRDGASDFLDGRGGEPVVIDYDVARIPRAPDAVAGSSS